nr:MAG TPA: hypothetical protein [Caudoviricetes sp.]
MSLTTSEMTPADIAAVTNGGNSGLGLGGDGAIWIIFLFLFVFCGWGGNWGGNGFGNGNSGGVVDGYVLTSDFANVERKIDSVNQGLCDGFYQQAQLVNGTNMTMANGFAQAELSRSNQQAALMQQLTAMQMQSQNCCCETREAIQGVNYNLATQSCETRNLMQTGTRDLIENQNSNTRAILDALTAQRIEAKDAKIAEQNQQLFAAQLAASQAAQNTYLVSTLRPTPIPAYQSCNPWAGTAAYGCCTT